MSDLEIIALAIGRHFWDCESDQGNINCGMDCAKEVADAINGEPAQTRQQDPALEMMDWEDGGIKSVEYEGKKYSTDSRQAVDEKGQ